MPEDKIISISSELKLTDPEQRIFLSAISRELKVCKEVDKEHEDAEVCLVSVCRSIERKVKQALF